MTGPPMALAYCNHGRWIADCPRPHCGSAEQLTPWQPWFVCSHRYCRAEAPIQWPPDLIEISKALAIRGAPQWMNWFPHNHPLAVRGGWPHGQTVAELDAESAEHAAEIAEWHGLEQLEGAERHHLG